MKTIVYQSYRTHEVPAWITRCLESVRDWAEAKGFDYRFFGDEFLERAGNSYLEKVRRNVLLTSDFSRLLTARDFLSGGYERTIWVDADVFIFDPVGLEVQVDMEYAFCDEIWMEKTSFSDRMRNLILRKSYQRFQCDKRVNNAVCVFVAGNSLLDFYIHAVQRIVASRNPDAITPWTAGVGFLTRLNSAIKLPLLKSVGQFNPLLLDAVCNDRRDILSCFASRLDQPIQAANLCSSYSSQGYQGIRLSAAQYLLALRILADSKGNVINGLMRPAGARVAQA